MISNDLMMMLFNDDVQARALTALVNKSLKVSEEEAVRWLTSPASSSTSSSTLSSTSSSSSRSSSWSSSSMEYHHVHPHGQNYNQGIGKLSKRWGGCHDHHHPHPHNQYHYHGYNHHPIQGIGKSTKRWGGWGGGRESGQVACVIFCNMVLYGDT